MERVKIFAAYTSFQDLEVSINEWLSKNPTAVVVGRTQTFGRGYLIVLVWYE
ncbi:MAG: hypothetical protein NTZ36_02880 [Candidatus Jorgensenbacteria bacterium]|nr:hypothetical protein [Candidatus Jorgensenbacteria bacterium]